MKHKNYDKMGVKKKRNLLFSKPHYVKVKNVQFKINADFVFCNIKDECYREIMVSYLPMLPLLEKTVPLEEADYIIYMHTFAICTDMSDKVLQELHYIDCHRKKGAEIIVLGKAANAELFLNGSIKNITFWPSHFTEKLGKKFNFDIKEKYIVWDDDEKWLSIFPVDGCLQKCKFCRMSFMKIPFESISLDIIKQNLDFIKKHFPKRLSNIKLYAENLTEYGIDIYGEQSFHKLLSLLNQYEEIKNILIDFGLAIGEITPDILKSICECSKLARIAMNLEAGSNRLLNVIGKQHTVEHAIYIFSQIRDAHPNISLGSVVMIGLPTEEDIDIVELAELIGKTHLDLLRVNYYVASPKHPLAKLPQISEDTRELHLKTFLEALTYTLKKEVSVMHPVIFSNSKSIEKAQKKLNKQKYTGDTSYFATRTVYRPK